MHQGLQSLREHGPHRLAGGGTMSLLEAFTPAAAPPVTGGALGGLGAAAAALPSIMAYASCKDAAFPPIETYRLLFYILATILYNYNTETRTNVENNGKQMQASLCIAFPPRSEK